MSSVKTEDIYKSIDYFLELSGQETDFCKESITPVFVNMLLRHIRSELVIPTKDFSQEDLKDLVMDYLNSIIEFEEVKHNYFS